MLLNPVWFFCSFFVSFPFVLFQFFRVLLLTFVLLDPKIFWVDTQQITTSPQAPLKNVTLKSIMGNQGSSSSKRDSKAKATEEPLESYLREKQRNDHLQNLGLKRHTSFRKSLTKRLKKRKRRPSLQQQNSKDQQNEPSVTETSQIDGPSTSSNNHCDLHEPQPSFRRSSFGNIKRSNSNPTLSTSSKVSQR